MTSRRKAAALVAADLRHLPQEVARQLPPLLRQAAEPIAAEARRRAGWSTRIPNAITVRTRMSARGAWVQVRVNRRIAPHGRPYENVGRTGTFRRPVWPGKRPRGQWKWRTERAKPFLLPAAIGASGQAAERVMQAVDTAAARAGFRRN